MSPSAQAGGREGGMMFEENFPSSFREACVKVAKASFADVWNDKRVEFIPVEWRTRLSLDNGTFAKGPLEGTVELYTDCIL